MSEGSPCSSPWLLCCPQRALGGSLTYPMKAVLDLMHRDPLPHSHSWFTSWTAPQAPAPLLLGDTHHSWACASGLGSLGSTPILLNRVPAPVNQQVWAHPWPRRIPAPCPRGETLEFTCPPRASPQDTASGPNSSPTWLHPAKGLLPSDLTLQTPRASLTCPPALPGH